MSVLVQRTELSTVDADGNIMDDLAVSIDNVVGFALDIFKIGDTPEVITIATVTAELWRWRHDYERTSPAVARRVVVDDALVTAINGDNVNITIPADTMEADRTYQLLIIATDDGGDIWPRTREYRAVA